MFVFIAVQICSFLCDPDLSILVHFEDEELRTTPALHSDC